MFIAGVDELVISALQIFNFILNLKDGLVEATLREVVQVERAILKTDDSELLVTMDVVLGITDAVVSFYDEVPRGISELAIKQRLTRLFLRHL